MKETKTDSLFSDLLENKRLKRYSCPWRSTNDLHSITEGADRV